MSSVERSAALRADFDRLAGEAARRLRGARLRRGVSSALPEALWVLALIPAAYALVQLVRLACGGAATGTGAGTLALWALGCAVAWPVLRGLELWMRPVERATALAAIDRQLDLRDRLQTADEFLAREQTTAFMDAAVEDGALRLERALAARLALNGEPLRPGRRHASLVFAALLAILAGVWLAGLGGLATARGDSDPAQLEALGPGGAEPRAEEPVSDPDPRRPETEEAGAREVQSPRSETGEAHEDLAAQVSESSKESRGRTAAGRSADARSTSGSSSSRGAPSGQSQTPKGEPRPPGEQKEHKPQDAVDPEEPPERKNEEDSGSTAGKGSSRGSNKNTAASTWSSRDKVPSPDEEEIEDDDEAEDEEEEQQSRGGIQPNLRDRKPPVSRDLQIGFGNGKDPDANGRGGPSQPKKSRGTASLVLGVPIPDRVKGQPGPGKTKITQERIEPTPEEAWPEDASPRDPRGAPSGYLSAPDLAPWMRGVVTSYFLTLRHRLREST